MGLLSAVGIESLMKRNLINGKEGKGIGFYFPSIVNVKGFLMKKFGPWCYV